jgi:nucleoid-associated protein YgaU
MRSRSGQYLDYCRDTDQRHARKRFQTKEDRRMGLLTFIKEAGEKLFGKRDAEAASTAPAGAPDAATANRAAADAILGYVKAQNLPTIGITVAFDGATSTVKVAGSVPDQESKEKILLCCGNVAGVEHVEEELLVETVEPEAEFYTVEKGDNLSKISKMHYGDPNKYMLIFEANKPMLKHPDKIYPGQMLRIPPL